MHLMIVLLAFLGLSGAHPQPAPMSLGVQLDSYRVRMTAVANACLARGTGSYAEVLRAGYGESAAAELAFAAEYRRHYPANQFSASLAVPDLKQQIEVSIDPYLAPFPVKGYFVYSTGKVGIRPPGSAYGQNTLVVFQTLGHELGHSTQGKAGETDTDAMMRARNDMLRSSLTDELDLLAPNELQVHLMDLNRLCFVATGHGVRGAVDALFALRLAGFRPTSIECRGVGLEEQRGQAADQFVSVVQDLFVDAADLAELLNSQPNPMRATLLRGITELAPGVR